MILKITKLHGSLRNVQSPDEKMPFLAGGLSQTLLRVIAISWLLQRVSAKRFNWSRGVKT